MKTWDYEAVGYEGDTYCIGCLPDGVGMQSGNVAPIFECSSWDTYPICIVCGHEHDYVGLILED